MALFTKIPIITEVAGVGNINTDLPPHDLPLAKRYFRPKISKKTQAGYKIIRNSNTVRFIEADLIWTSVSKADRDILNAFYLAHEGAVIPTLWTPLGTPTQLLFKIKGFKREEKIEPNIYNFGFTIEQLTP